MPYNFAADSFHTKKLCSRFSSSEVRFFTQIDRFTFLATYEDHLRLIRKCVFDFLLSSYEVFSLGVTSKALRAIIGSSKSAILLQQGPVDPKFQVEGIAPPTKHSFSQKTRLNGLSYGIKFGQIFLPFCRNSRV